MDKKKIGQVDLRCCADIFFTFLLRMISKKRRETEKNPNIISSLFYPFVIRINNDRVILMKGTSESDH